MTAQKKEEIELLEDELSILKVKIKNKTEYISTKFSEEAFDKIWRKHLGLEEKQRENKIPQKIFKSTIYYHPDGGYGIPSTAFKAAMVNAARNIDSMKMTGSRQAFFIPGEFVKITKGKPRMRKDIVRLANGNSDIRIRAGFPKWEADLVIEYDSGVISKNQLLNVIRKAGDCVGVGDWRPAGKKSSGPFGRFEIVTKKRKK